jgi:hypothetical protein
MFPPPQKATRLLLGQDARSAKIHTVEGEYGKRLRVRSPRLEFCFALVEASLPSISRIGFHTFYVGVQQRVVVKILKEVPSGSLRSQSAPGQMGRVCSRKSLDLPVFAYRWLTVVQVLGGRRRCWSSPGEWLSYRKIPATSAFRRLTVCNCYVHNGLVFQS